jgi:hypothetical protein
LTLLEDVVAHLVGRQVAHALIGAVALAAHGVSRSTLDQDLLVIERRVLNEGFWDPLGSPVSIDVRAGDTTDPLAGVVRLRRAKERDVDVVVGRHEWQRPILERAIPVGDGHLRVVRAADLILLKLFAGGTQDKWDIEQLLGLDQAGALAEDVDSHASVLPADSREVWAQLRAGRRP